MNTEKSNGAAWLRFWPVGSLAIFAVLMALMMPQSSHSQSPQGPPLAVRPVPEGMAAVTLGGGCFWSMEAIYTRLNGVQSAQTGYAGGKAKNPTYEQVSSGTTGHAESVNIIYDPKVISYGELVEVLLTVLDPTTPNQQGADTGTNYRSIIFYRNPQERKIARETIEKVQDSGLWKSPIVTQVEPLNQFYAAEEYHQNYYDAHPDLGYCKAVIVPKLDKLHEHFAAKMKK